MGKTILVYDDESSILEVIIIILEQEDYTVVTANSAEYIIEDIKKYKPSLILLDIWMKGINGNEAANKLKSNEKYKAIPIILISALNETERIAGEVKADGFLKKPFDMDALLDMVKQNIS
jgi:CheY-like chemotaxis protein